MLVAARLEPVDKDPPAIDEDTREGPESEDATVDLSAGELRRLTPEGETSWRIPLRATRLLQAPEIALDAAGCAYVAGPYAPHKGALRGAVLWGSFQGNIEFASDLRVSSLPRARYLTRVQADGFVRWADVLRAYGDTPHAVAVAEDVAR